jgi:hypothetical protein
MDTETKEILRTVLEQQRAIVKYCRRQHEWISALTDTLQSDAALKPVLEAHSSFDLGRDPSLQMLSLAAENIDVLIQRLKEKT